MRAQLPHGIPKIFEARGGQRVGRAALARLAAQAGFAERYELGEELGRGGMGVVRRARDRRLGRELALKLVRARPGEERARAGRGARDARG